MFHVDGAHLCKLYQMGRSCIDIGAAVDQQGHALFCRNQWSQWRTFNALDSADDHLSADQNRAGAARGTECIRLTPADHIHADHDRRIFLRADRIDRRFLRLDDLSRIDNLDLFFLICMLF